MGVGPVFFLLLAIVRTTLSYRDYPASPMPDYDLDDDTRQSRSRSQYSTQQSQHADDDEDYEYDDKGDDSKSPKDFYVDDAISSKSIRDKTDTDLYNEQEMEQQSRRRKTIKHKNTVLDYEDDDREMKYNNKFVVMVKSRNRHIEDYNIDKEDYHLKDDDYKENDEKERKRYKSKEFNKRKPRRKPRDRPTKVIIGDNEHAQSNTEKSMRRKTRKDSIQEKSDKEAMAKAMLAETFDDIKRVNSFKDNLPLIIRQPVNLTEFSSPSYSDVLLYRRADKVDDTTPTLNVSDALSLTVNNTLKTKTANKTELSLAERSRLSILKKVLKKENSNVTKTTKPPILMQVTNNMQTVVLVESNNLDNDRKKARRVMDDNPQTIQRAKHLMRQKLVANARRIEDLTDNWDELVCDYIDVNLLNSASSTNICYVLCCMKLIVSLVFDV